MSTPSRPVTAAAQEGETMFSDHGAVQAVFAVAAGTDPASATKALEKERRAVGGNTLDPHADSLLAGPGPWTLSRDSLSQG